METNGTQPNCVASSVGNMPCHPMYFVAVS